LDENAALLAIYAKALESRSKNPSLVDKMAQS
jgi:hypothetical protein